MTELTTTTRLLDELAFLLNRLLDALTVRYLRSTNCCINIEFTTHTVNQNFQAEQDDQAPDPFFPGQPWFSAQQQRE